MNSITNRATLGFLILLLPIISGCSTFELEGSGSITPSAITGSETVHGSLYGYRWRSFAIEKCATDSLFRVEFHTNAALLLVSVATLGLYVPQTVEWWCYTPAGGSDNDVNDASEEVWVPPAQSNQG